MAKAGFIFHGARGKVGNQVLQKGENGTIQRELVVPKNPRTSAQAKQRCAFAMATSAAAGLKFLVNHSFQGIKTEKENIREFVRINSKMLRAEIETSLSGGHGVKGNLQIKGARGMQAADYIVSRGSVFFPQFEDAGALGPGVKIALQGENAASSLTATISTQEAYEAALATLALKPGDQLSVVGIVTFPTMIAEYDTEKNWLGQPYGARVTFKTQIPDGFNGKLIDNEGVIAAELIEEKLGDFTIVLTDSNAKVGLIISDVPTSGVVEAVGAIRSCKDLNSEFTYSPCQLLWLGEGLHDPTVVQSYMNQAKSERYSDYFLDQPEYAPFVQGE